MIKVLVINSGSSSIKYQLFDMSDSTVLVSGAVERIGEAESLHWQRLHGGDSVAEKHSEQAIADHREALARIGTLLRESGALTALSELSAIGHRIVHGGESFREPTRITAVVVEQIRQMIPLAPLHNPANLMGIEIALQYAPDTPQVAVFDTAFHHSIPEHAWRYALPDHLYTEWGIRRYGFHGTSHGYVAKQAASSLGKPLESLNLITLHLGNGASAAAIAQGQSVDTSMGMTPLEGLVMGTRCGDIDPAIPFYLGRASAMDNTEIESLLNKESGLKGICGSNDMREVIRLADAGDAQARLALDMYCYRIKKYIGAYYAVLGKLDAIVFTGGIGENAAWVREQCCAGLEALGIVLDRDKNIAVNNKAFDIHGDAASVNLLVIPTNEELEIALQTVSCIYGLN
ncbi:Acetate kinase [hydrothermal vent metagenome]|uniref:Acetate kinase n=1 Tax=hydrothermal vent metagenome TaxID=652676 RepID=A0A3B0Y9Y3_9ZZZZ